MNYQRNEGITKKIARSRIAVGCNWMAVPGSEYPMNDCVKINVARIFDIAFHEMLDDQESEKSIAGLLSIFEKHLEIAVDVTAKGILHHLTYQHYIMPELVMNLMMKNTLETGQDISICAELKTIGIDGVGLGTIADSLSAMEQRIEKEKLLSWEELHDVIHSNFEGPMGERIRLMLKSSPRYCQGNSLGDSWAIKISELFARKVRERKMPDDIQLIPGWFSWSSTIYFGKKVGATADGRFAYSPITHGANPNAGFRQDGAPTAMATGVAAIQTNYGNTCPLQIEFDPKISAEQGGIDRVEQVLKTHVKNGGTLININILDKEKLMKANENPMLYPDLVVRVTGFTAYFATLSPQIRKLVIDRFIDGM
jgi:formate C-acetyltransferase